MNCCEVIEKSVKKLEKRLHDDAQPMNCCCEDCEECMQCDDTGEAWEWENEEEEWEWEWEWEDEDLPF